MTTLEAPVASTPVNVGEPAWHRILAFYFHEAELLDDNRLVEWLGLLDADLTYEMPLRVTRRRSAGAGFSAVAKHFEDDRASMERRVRRLTDTDTAWAEDPPSRTRRFVSNLVVGEIDGGFTARSSLLILRSRWTKPSFELFSASRHDILFDHDGTLRLRARTILVDQSTLGSSNLALFY